MSWIEVSAEAGSVRPLRVDRCPASGRREYDILHYLSVDAAEVCVEAMVAAIEAAKVQSRDSLEKRRVELNEKKARLASELKAVEKELGKVPPANEAP